MRDRIDEGSWAWKQRENDEHMIALQEERAPAPSTAPSASIELAYLGGSCFRITSPAGLTVLIDPWRNPPWGNWDWYLFDFPPMRSTSPSRPTPISTMTGCMRSAPRLCSTG